MRIHPSIPSGYRFELVRLCNKEMRKLDGVRDFAFVYPKRHRHGGDTAEDDDKVNPAMLLCDDLLVLNSAENAEEGYESKGSLFQELVEAATKYTDILGNFKFSEFRPCEENTSRLEQLLLDIGVLLKERTGDNGVVDSKLEVFIDAEKCLFATDKPKLDILKDSAWAKGVLARRFE